MKNKYLAKFGKTLTSLTLVGTLSLGGCLSKGEYYFDGVIDDEHIEFSGFSDWKKIRLSVTKPDGELTEYDAGGVPGDYSDKSRVFSVRNIKDGRGNIYYYNDKCFSFEEAQEQFDGYLAKIKKLKNRSIKNDR